MPLLPSRTSLAIAPILLLVVASPGAQVQWSELQPAARPPAVVAAWDRMAYDVGRARIVLVRGHHNAQQPLETWEWDGVTWTRASPQTNPSPRHGYGLVYDGARGHVLLYGGFNTLGPGKITDTWAWDGTDWRLLSAQGPDYLWPSLAYDAARREVVLFGGIRLVGANRTWPTETWTWDGVRWTQRFPTQAPPGRHVHGMVFDERRAEVVLFGGSAANNKTGRADTWTWDGTDWQQRTPALSPSARWVYTMVRDPARDRTVLYSGDNKIGTAHVFYRDTWEWDGRSWIQRAPASRPRANWNESAAYHAGRRQTVLFGGVDQPSFQIENATWVYGPVSPGTYGVLGAGCAGSAGVPSLVPATAGMPYTGDTFELQVQSLPAGVRPVVGVVGIPLTTPVSLAPWGMPGCQQYATFAVTVSATASGGTWRWVLGIPQNAALVGAGLAVQALVADAAANPLGVVASNAGAVLVGAK